MAPQWSLVLFTFFFCMAGGTLAIQGLFTLTNRGRKVQVPMLATSAAALVAGMAALCTRFQHIERLFNAFGSATGGTGVSGLTLVLWIGILCAAIITLYFVLTHRSENSEAPHWCGAVAVVAGFALTVLLGSTYKTASIPAGIVPLLNAYYLCNAILFGSLVALALSRLCNDDDAADTAVKIGLVGGIGSLATVLFYGFALGSFDQAGSTARYSNWATTTVVTASTATTGSSLVAGPQAPLFWGLVVALGAIVPIAGIVAGRQSAGKKGAAIAVVALACAIAGSIVWRCLL